MTSTCGAADWAVRGERCEGTGAPELGLALRCEDGPTTAIATGPACRPVPKMVYRWARREQPTLVERCDGQKRSSVAVRAREWSRLVRAVAANHAALRKYRDHVEVAGEC